VFNFQRALGQQKLEKTAVGVIEWIENVRGLSSTYKKIKEDERVKLVLASLPPETAAMVKTCGPATVEEVTEEVDRLVNGDVDVYARIRELNELRMTSGTMLEHEQAFRARLRLVDVKEFSPYMMRAVVIGSMPPSIRARLRNAAEDVKDSTKLVKALFAAATLAWNELGHGQAAGATTAAVGRPATRASAASPPSSRVASSSRGKNSNFARELTPETVAGVGESFDGECFRCGHYGHMAQDCQEAHPAKRTRSSESSMRGRGRGRGHGGFVRGRGRGRGGRGGAA
jgi:hypothetical protein